MSSEPHPATGPQQRAAASRCSSCLRRSELRSARSPSLSGLGGCMWKTASPASRSAELTEAAADRRYWLWGWVSGPCSRCRPAQLPGRPDRVDRPQVRVHPARNRRRGDPQRNVVNARSEELAGGAGRESYDAVTARAVGRLSTLAELASPLLREDGVLVAWKGKRDPDEEAAAGPSRRAAGDAPRADPRRRRPGRQQAPPPARPAQARTHASRPSAPPGHGQEAPRAGPALEGQAD